MKYTFKYCLWAWNVNMYKHEQTHKHIRTQYTYTPNMHPCALQSSIGINNEFDWVGCRVYRVAWLKVFRWCFFFIAVVVFVLLCVCFCLLQIDVSTWSSIDGLTCQFNTLNTLKWVIFVEYVPYRRRQINYQKKEEKKTNNKRVKAFSLNVKRKKHWRRRRKKKVRSSLALLPSSRFGTLFVFGWQRVLFCKQSVWVHTHWCHIQCG